MRKERVLVLVLVFTPTSPLLIFAPFSDIMSCYSCMLDVVDQGDKGQRGDGKRKDQGGEEEVVPQSMPSVNPAVTQEKSPNHEDKTNHNCCTNDHI